ncbi:hypothetical protein CASFOL_024827 [Castilleja foliolosa]|uniref:BRCT domain-containing protein n=1 Tax=Castilleja foliolosa TaxID=1961234 RepID=A0ABD3CPG8_9LAMI
MSESDKRKRNLPSWMSSREEENDDSEKSKQPRNNGKSTTDQNASATISGASNFSKLMEGIVFSLSGFVNPERGVLRSQMLEMGAEYKPDWNAKCTLLVCAFSNTPKFRQVKAEGGTIISKDWISECHNQKNLVDIEPFLLHAGKPWRRQNISHEASEDIKPSISNKPLKQEEKSTHPKNTCVSSKIKNCIAPSKAKKWAVEDLKRTISWLESQEEKPEPSEIKKIAAEGILTCLQDAIDALKQGQDIQKIAEQWACLPRVVDELLQFDRSNDDGKVKKDLCLEAIACKQIYELEFLNMEHEGIVVDKKKPQSHGSKKVNKKENVVSVDHSDDSDATIEMNEEEIDQAYNSIICSL